MKNDKNDNARPHESVQSAIGLLQILTRGDQTLEEEVALCIGCRKFGNRRCPHLGNEPKGYCEGFRPERKPERTELRVMKFLQERH